MNPTERTAKTPHRCALVALAALTTVLAILMLAAASANATENNGSPQNCPNEQLRAEQPYGLELPDCRAYELASPLNTEGNDAVDTGCGFESRVSVSGDAVAYAAVGSFGEPVGARFCNMFISKRGPDGWSTRSITPPHRALEEYAGGLFPAYEGMFFSTDLSKGVVVGQSTPLTSGAPQSNSMYLANLASGSYELVRGGEEEPPLNTSSDLSRLLVGHEREGGFNEWVEGRGAVEVAVKNSGESFSAGAGSGSLNSGGELSDHWHAMSSDGRRIFMTSYGTRNGRAGRELYVRENPEQPQSPVAGGLCTVSQDACTIDVSASQKTNGSGPNGSDPHAPYPARFWGASAEGSRVFFTSKVELTNDAYTGPEDNRANLYEYNVESGELADLTVDPADAKGADVLGVVGISEDGSYVYFVAKGALAAGAVAGHANLYVSHEGGPPRYITVLANRTAHEEIEESGNEEAVREEVEENPYPGTGDGNDWAYGPERNQAAVSPDGTRLAFISDQSLTGYDNILAENSEKQAGCEEGNRCKEVYLYDASTGSLACVSCNQSGARPLGPSSLRTEGGYGYNKGGPLRSFSENGALVFESNDALVPHDSNGRQDVYEYEGGHVYPLSNVAGGYNSYLLDASPSGDDVFISTNEPLLPQAPGLRAAVYDVRVDGGLPVAAAPPECDNGDSCKPPPSRQPGVFGPPASATFSGAGNLAPLGVSPGSQPAVKAKTKPARCKKKRLKKDGRCVKPKTRRSSGHSNKGRK